jgi:hypothetical protein
VKLDVSIETKDKKTVCHEDDEQDSASFMENVGKGWNQFVKIEDIFDSQNQYLVNDVFTLVITVI